MYISPKIWGEQVWFFMYCVAFSFPDDPSRKEQNNVSNFFKSLGKALPCKVCRSNFKKHLVKYPLKASSLTNKKALVSWVVNVANKTNKTNLSYEQVEKSFREKIAKHKTTKKREDLSIAVVVTVIAVVIALLSIAFWQGRLSL